MARKLTDIYNALALEKSAQAKLANLQPDIDTAQDLLTDLNSTSRVSRWRLMLWVVAVAMWVHENLWDQFRAEVEQLAAASHIGTSKWYQEQALLFQYGHALVELNGLFQYAEVDLEARIIARAAVIEQNGTVLVKVAKMVSGSLVALSPGELDAFREYLDDIKMAGTIVNVFTDGPDLLRLDLLIQYDPLVLNASGGLISSPSTKPVEVAINDYLRALPFNGKLVLTDLVDAIQVAKGVENPTLREAEAKYASFSYTTIDIEYSSNSGHMIIDPAFPLNLIIDYSPYYVG